MFQTEQEIMEQHIALKKTFDFLISEKEKIVGFFAKQAGKKFIFMGCGSSYMLAKSGQRLFAACPGTAAVAIAGGDYLANQDFYAEMVKDSVIIMLSRSGLTSEMVRSAKHMKAHYNSPVISVTMKQGNGLEPYSDLSLVMDWCYDLSVCQTRTVTNLYMTLLILAAFYQDDERVLSSIKGVIDANEAYKENYRPLLKKLAKRDWNNAIVLADGPVSGLAEEGALAFTEIAMIPGKSFNLLDYRHGPIVLLDNRTLVIALLNGNDPELEGAMVADLKNRGGIVVTVSQDAENTLGADAHISFGHIEGAGERGIPFIYVMQMVAYEKAVANGTNPDTPNGLDAYITL